MGKAKRRRRTAPRTTPARAHFVEVDDTRTFLVFGAFTESMIVATLGKAPRPSVRCDLTGRWNHGAEDKPVLVVSPEVAREWAAHLRECADAAERDLVTYLAGVNPDDGSPR